MNASLGLTQIVVMVGVLAVAIVYDCRCRRIPNALVLVGTLSGLVVSFTAAGGAGLITSLYGMGVAFVLLLPGFLLHFTGAGDVKLLAALGTFLGPVGVFHTFLASIFLGAAFVLLYRLSRVSLSGLGRHLRRYGVMLEGVLYSRKLTYKAPDKESVLAMRLPMAPVFAAGVAVTLLLRHAGVWV